MYNNALQGEYRIWNFSEFLLYRNHHGALSSNFRNFSRASKQTISQTRQAEWNAKQNTVKTSPNSRTAARTDGMTLRYRIDLWMLNTTVSPNYHEFLANFSPVLSATERRWAHRCSAICIMREGRKLPSVSTYTAIPSHPSNADGICTFRAS